MKHYVGYASHVIGSPLAEQLAALEAAGAKTIYANACCQEAGSHLPEFFKQLNSGDVLLVWKLTVLNLSVPNLIEFMVLLGQRDVRLKSLSEDWFDTTGPNGGLIRKLFSTLQSFGENEARRLSVMQERRQNRSPGKSLGRPPILTEAQVADVVRRRQAGQSIVEIAEFFDVGRMTVTRALRRASQEPVRNIRVDPGQLGSDQVSISIFDQAAQVTPQE